MQHLFNLLAVLRAAQMSHHHAHWCVKGEAFFADHELFSDLYTSMDSEIDTLAEKSVNQFGVKVVDLCAQLAMMHKCAETWDSEPDLYRRALEIEQGIQRAIVHCRKALDADDALSLGLDNFLVGIADSHEKPLYLLGRRLGGAK